MSDEPDINDFAKQHGPDAARKKIDEAAVYESEREAARLRDERMDKIAQEGAAQRRAEREKAAQEKAAQKKAEREDRKAKAKSPKGSAKPSDGAQGGSDSGTQGSTGPGTGTNGGGSKEPPRHPGDDPRGSEEPPPHDEEPPHPSDGDDIHLAGSGVRDDIPKDSERPCFAVFDEWKKSDGRKCRPGVWWFAIREVKGETQLIDLWICTPIHVDAVTHDGKDNNFGRCLRFRNTNKRWRIWSMPMELLAGDGVELRSELLSMGVEISPQGKQLLTNYLQGRHPKRRMLCALQVGWHGKSFVLPDTVIGPGAEDVIFQSGERGKEEYGTGGTLKGWQTEIAARAIGNPMLVLSISSAFAGPLLARCHAESGGIHLVGPSSIGKTTGVDVACSVWGGKKHKREWRATANGMESAATLFNDNLLPLDEISLGESKDIGPIVYMLGDGRGKQRASRTGYARDVARFSCFVLSSGETTIATAMLEGGFRVKAGQSVRLLDVLCERQFGFFDALHGYASGAAFSDALKHSAIKHHGHAGRAFLERLTHDERNISDYLERLKKETKGFRVIDAKGQDKSEGQDKRAAARFALVALAGELAIEYGVVPWKEGTALEAAIVGYRAWQSQRASGNNEPRQILERVSAFIERHGDSRFSHKANVGDVVRDRAGWWHDDDVTLGRIYLFTSEGLREALKGFDFSPALNVLETAGVLVPPPGQRDRRQSYKIGGRKVALYTIVAEKLGGTQ
jgi:putative DNA primase/helicase